MVLHQSFRDTYSHIRDVRQFNEAMELTGRAKAAFPLDLDDLRARGARLIRESVQYGVTSMRAHVEVDSIVGFCCLDIAQTLQKEFRTLCDVQIAGEFFASSAVHMICVGDTSLCTESLLKSLFSMLLEIPYPV